MAKYDVVMTAPTVKDMQGIVDYIANDLREPVTAKRQLERIRDVVLSLADFPTRYALVADEVLAAKGYRKIVVDNYIILYITSNTKEIVTVVRVIDSRRDWLIIL